MFLRKAIIHFVLPNIFLDITDFHYVPVFVDNFLSIGRLYVTEKRVKWDRIVLEVFQSDLLLRLSTLLI